MPPQAINTNSETGEPIDEMGRRFVYKCRVPDCDRATRGAKSTAYKEYVFHCYQAHGLMKVALEDSMENTNNLETKQKFRELMLAVQKPEEEEIQLAVISDPGVEEIHTCLLCKGINRDTKKENKEAKVLKFNICITRNHYANCLNETEEGRIFFETTYMTGLDPSQPVKIKCEDPRWSISLRVCEIKLVCAKFHNLCQGARRTRGSGTVSPATRCSTTTWRCSTGGWRPSCGTTSART